MPAQSQQQQKLFGLALSVKRRETPRSEASSEVLDIVDSMTEKQIEDFASTSHSGLPSKVEAKLRELVRDSIKAQGISEAISSKDLEAIKGAVEKASSFMSVGSELKKLGMRYIFATSPMPVYIVQDKSGNRVGIVNKKYATKPDFVVGDIAVGVMENILKEGLFQNIMKGVKKGDGPFTLVVIKNNKVVKQVDAKTPQVIPAHYTSLEKEFPNSRIRVEDSTGKIVFGESVNEGIGTIALGVAGGLLLLKVLKFVLKKVVGAVGMNVALPKEKLLEVVNNMVKNVLAQSSGKQINMFEIVALQSYLKDEINAGRITTVKQIVKVIDIISKKKNESVNEENEPTNPELWDRAIAAAKREYDVYPSAYANAFASKWYKEKGGDWKTKKESVNEAISRDAAYIHGILKSGQDATQNFIDDNGLDGEKLSDYVKANRNNIDGYNVKHYISGERGTVGSVPKLRQAFIKKFKKGKSANEGIINEDTKRANILGIDFNISEMNGRIFFSFKDNKAASIKIREIGTNKIVNHIQKSLDNAYGKGEFFFKGGDHAEFQNGYLFQRSISSIKLNKLKFESVKEGELNEAYVPSNIAEFAKRKGVSSLVKTVAGWAEKVGKRIVGGTAIGKNYDTLILDMTYQGSEIYINTEYETVELYDEPVRTFAQFKSVYKENLGEGVNETPVNESSVEIGDIVFFPPTNSAATVIDRFGRSVTLKLANGKKVKTVVDKVKLLAQDGVNEHKDCGCGCGGVTEGGCGTSLTEGQLNEWKAEEVLQQLGGRKFIAMTGAKNFVKNDKDKSIVFRVPKAKNSINTIRITLTSSDLYNVEFISVRGTNIKTVKEVRGVYNDQLQSIFTQYTGLYTSL